MATPLHCHACGIPLDQGRTCADCAAAGELLDPELHTRRRALAGAGLADRPRVLTAALRGGALWSGAGPGGEDLGRAILGWLVRHGMTLRFARWLAEDARYGDLVYGVLAKEEPTRSLQRAPAWLAPGRPAARVAPLVRGWWGDPAHQCALAFRLGSTPLPETVGQELVASVQTGLGLPVRLALQQGRKHPTGKAWQVPDAVLAAAPRWQRWPLEQLRPGAVACCVGCGEALPEHGPCRFCGADPKVPGNTLALPLAWLFEERRLCPTCGIDQSTKVVPRRCPGCLEPIAYSDLGMVE